MSLPLPGASSKQADATSLNPTSGLPIRIDSPFDTRLSVSSAEGSTADEAHPVFTTGRGMATTRRGRNSPLDQNPEWMFVVAGHPIQFKNPHQMRSNRQHVMDNVVRARRAQEGGSRARVNKTPSSRKRKRSVDPSATEASIPRATSSIFAPEWRRQSPASPHWGTGRPRRTISPNTVSSAHRPSVAAVPPLAPLSAPPQAVSNENETSNTRSSTQSRFQFANDVRPLVRGAGGFFNNSTYLRASPDTIPFHVVESTESVATSSESAESPVTFVGSVLNPFLTWPEFQSSRLNVQELKWSCSRRFGSQGISTDWIPVLLRARHAFLSTICISSAHDDVMSRALKPPHERSAHESYDHLQSRIEVIALVNQAMNDPQMATADETIVAVLHLLNAELIGCDDQVTKVHQEGLHKMVQSRGGLKKLGVGGQLASISTITMYLISALRESTTHQDFVEYASQHRAKPADDGRPIPESPVYCRLTGFITIKRAPEPPRVTLDLLEDLRILTNAFVRGTGYEFISPLTPVRRVMSWNHESDNVPALYDRIISTPPAGQLHGKFNTAHEKYVYEALRLVGMVYAFALTYELPFSQAAAALPNSGEVREHDRPSSNSGATRHTTTTSSSSVSPDDFLGGFGSPGSPGVAMHIRIKNALSRTNITDCWGPMNGVLFWIVIVAAASANPERIRSPDTSPTESAKNEEEFEEARKWLTAIAVRCSILLGFEHGGAVLETLKRLVGIEQALKKADQERRSAATDSSSASQQIPAEWTVTARPVGEREPQPLQRKQASSFAYTARQAASSNTAPASYGPPLPWVMQLGFHDFALDFEGEMQ